MPPAAELTQGSSRGRAMPESMRERWSVGSPAAVVSSRAVAASGASVT